jgi:hypothetical protein
MAMTLQSRKELYKLREIVHFLLAGAGATPHTPAGHFCCYFCKKLMHDLDFIRHGNSTGPKFNASISIHHIDGNHGNNDMMNKALCHASCHKSHHRKEANLARSRKP